MARSLGTRGGGRGFVLFCSFIFYFLIFYLSFSGLFFGIFFPIFCGLPSCSFIFCFLIFYLSFFLGWFCVVFYCLLNPSFFSILSLTFLSSTYVYGSFWVLFFFPSAFLLICLLLFLSFTDLFVIFLALFPSASWGLEF